MCDGLVSQIFQLCVISWAISFSMAALTLVRQHRYKLPGAPHRSRQDCFAGRIFSGRRDRQPLIEQAAQPFGCQPTGNIGLLKQPE